MSVKCEKVETNLSKLTFEVSAEEFEKAIDRAYLKERGKISVPGFRKGKAPKAVVYKYYSKSMFYNDALNDVLPDAYDVAVEESGLEIVARPEIDVEDIKDGEPVVFTALVTTKPEVTLGEYKGIKVSKVDYTVSDEDVDKEIEKAREQNARMISVDDRPVESGDTVVIDFEGFVDGKAFDGGKGEDYELVVGSETFIPGFEDQLVGAELDKEIEVNVTFPEKYNVEELCGKDALFKVTVNEIKVKELPELDDDFASEVSDFETFDEYKADLRKQLEERAANNADIETKNKIIEKIMENCEIEIPDVMIESQTNRSINEMAQNVSYQGLDFDTYLKYTGQTLEGLREQFKERSERQVRGGLVLEAIANKEGVEVSPEELELELVDMAKKYGMELDKLKEMLSEDAIENIKVELKSNKTVDMLANFAEIVEEDAESAESAE